LGRYGGEEFAMLLPMTQGLAAHNLLAERIRRAVCEKPIAGSGGPIHVTVSIGVSSLSPSIGTLEALLMQADSRMYEAKKEGRGAAESLGEELGGETRWKTIARGPGGSSFLFPVIEGGRSVGTLETFGEHAPSDQTVFELTLAVCGEVGPLLTRKPPEAGL